MIIYDETLQSHDGELQAVKNARAHLQHSFANSLPNIPEDLQYILRQLLLEAAPEDKPQEARRCAVPPVALVCYDTRSLPYKACTQGSTIWLCSSAFKRLEPILLHELVHVACGNELDSEAVENVRFTGPSGTLNFGDFKSIATRRWRGRWYRIIRQKNTKNIKLRYGLHTDVDTHTLELLAPKVVEVLKAMGTSHTQDDALALLQRIPEE